VNEERKKPKPLLEDWRVRGVAAAGVVAGFLIGLVIFGAPWRLPPAWGDIPTWLLAVLALAAGWVGFVQLGILRRQIAEEAERNEKRDRLLDKQIAEAEQRSLIYERQQAETVDIKPSYSMAKIVGSDPPVSHQVHAAEVSNDSRRPVRNVACRIEPGPGDTLQAAGKVGLFDEFTDGRRAFLPPRHGAYIPLLRAGETGGFIFTAGKEGHPKARFTVRLTDDAGLHWQIDPDLHLEKLPSRDDW
jgi:hypothetical protein